MRFNPLSNTAAKAKVSLGISLLAVILLSLAGIIARKSRHQISPEHIQPQEPGSLILAMHDLTEMDESPA